jgi:hypothetical protein
MNVLFGMALRQTTGFVKSLLRLCGLDWAVSNFSTLSRRQKTLKVNILIVARMLRCICWSTAPGSRSRVKASGTLVNTAARSEGSGARPTSGLTRNHWQSARPSLPLATSVTRRCCPNFLTRYHPTRRSLASRQMVPSPPAVPPRKSAKPWKPDTAGAIYRNDILRTTKRVGRPMWRRWKVYYRRSRAETKIHCVKLLGQHLSTLDFDRQVAEFQIRGAVLNCFTARGTSITEVAR